MRKLFSFLAPAQRTCYALPGIFLALFLGMQAHAQQGVSHWVIDHAHTQISFNVGHLMISEVEGHFHTFDGEMHIDSKEFTNSDVQFKVSTASIDTDVEMRDKDLRSDNFFSAEKFPYMEFRSNAIERVSNGKYLLKGTLTIRDITRPVTLDVAYGSVQVGTDGQVRLGFKVTGEINRFNYGLQWNKLTDVGGMVVGERVRIHCNLVLIRE